MSWDAPELDVSFYVHKYMEKTLALRLKAFRKGLGKPNQLFLSHKAGLPVAKGTISRWLKEILSLSGINTDMFSGGQHGVPQPLLLQGGEHQSPRY